MDPEDDRSGTELLAAGERALNEGNSLEAFDLLQFATQRGVPQDELGRLASALAMAGRYQSRSTEILEWLERVIHDLTEGPNRLASKSAAKTDAAPASLVGSVPFAQLLSTRLVVCRELDSNRVASLVPEALEAAEAAGDDDALASVLCSAAFAAYRRGDSQATRDYAERAMKLQLDSKSAFYDAVRTQMFAASVIGEIEVALNLATKARGLARELDRTAEVANESNNLAEIYLELGCPIEARACAFQGIQLARQSGNQSVEAFGQVLAAIATAETGELDSALAQFEQIQTRDPIFSIDMATAHAYWRVERGTDADIAIARELAAIGIANAKRTGVSNRLTALYANAARSYVRQGRQDKARGALEHARRVADRADPTAQSLLALATAEVLAPTEPLRNVVLTHARASILRRAQRREDPMAFCRDVRLNRRLLDLSGGIPGDLPGAA